MAICIALFRGSYLQFRDTYILVNDDFRDGLKESNVVTKTFQVEDAGLPSEQDFDNQMERDNEDTYRSENDFRPKYSHRPSSSVSKSKAWVFSFIYVLYLIHLIGWVLDS